MKWMHVPKMDLLLVIAVLALVGVGTVIIYSTSGAVALLQGRAYDFFISKHLVMVGMGVVAMFVMSRVDHSIYYKLARPAFWFGVLMLIAVVAGLGTSAHGAERWLNIGPLRIQPSEPMKLALFSLVAQRLSEAGDYMDPWRDSIFRPGFPLAVVFGLLMLQPNYSMAGIMSIVWYVMLFSAGVSWKRLVLMPLALAPVAVLLVVGSEYRLKRVMALLDPTTNTASAYQQLQSLISLGNGGFWGTGLGQGTQKMGYLPMPFTDMIYAILGEELGFVGSGLVLILFAILLWRGLIIARGARTRYAKYLAVGITTSIGITAAIHIAVCISIAPATGQPLPLVSYGGTSLVITMAAMGILLNISDPESGGSIEERTGGLT